MKAERTDFGRPGIPPWAALRGIFLRLGTMILFLAGVGSPAWAEEPARLLLLAPSEEQIEEREDLPGDFLIAISIIDPDAQIDLSSIRLYMDERDVTASATVTSAVVTYIPAPSLATGIHRFELRLRNTEGQDLPGLRREVRVEGDIPGEPVWGVRGRVVLESLSDDLSGPGAALRQQPDQTNTARVRLDGHMGGWKYDGTLFLTSDEDGAYQPRNRYKVHLDHGWVGLDAGDVNYTFSPLVLRGKRTRGVGGYLRLGTVEITALKGTIRRGIEGEVQTDAVGDTTMVSGASYERDLTGARLAFGRGRAFQLAFEGVRVRDDMESISVGLLPKDNLVVGSSVLLAPFKRRLIFDASAALSFITEDISGGAMSEQDIRDLAGETVDLPFEPTNFEDLFIINLSTRPLDPRNLSSLAFHSGVKGNLAGHVFEWRYRRVGTAFASLAAPSIQSDKKGLRVTDTFRLLRKRLRVFGEYEVFEDNLNDDKDFTTDTRVAGLTASFVPGWEDLRHVSFSFRQYKRVNDAPSPAPEEVDFRVDDRTNSVRVGTGYHFRFFSDHDVSLSYMRSDTEAHNASADATQAEWNFGWATRFETLPLVLEAGLGNSDTDYPLDGTHVEYNTRRVRGTYDLLDARLQTHASLTQVVGDSNRGVVAGDKTTIDAGMRYRLAAKTSVSGRLASVAFSDGVDPDNDYDETILNLRLVQEF